jgi:leader peptidase (prepilin peptidase)/N-methyltransferase
MIDLLPAWYWVMTVGLFGLATGSFLNVVAYRVPEGRSLWGRSHCPRCDHVLGPLDLLPVVGWILLLGRCRYCSQPIAWRYPAVELATGLLWAGTAALVGASWVLPAFLWTLSVTISLVLTDIDTHRLPNPIVYTGTIVGSVLLVVGSFLDSTQGRLGWAVAGGVLYFVVMLVLALAIPGGFGFGDVKMSFLLGAFVAFQARQPAVDALVALGSVGVAIFGAFLIGGLAAIVLLALRRRGRKDHLAFGPPMIFAAWIAAMWGTELVDLYLG